MLILALFVAAFFPLFYAISMNDHPDPALSAWILNQEQKAWLEPFDFFSRLVKQRRETSMAFCQKGWSGPVDYG